MKTTLNHKNIIGALVFYQLANRTASATDVVKINYRKPEIVDNGLQHYYEDSYSIRSDSIYVDYGGRRYKQSDLPIANKNLASYIVAQNSVAEIFHK